MKFLFFGGIFVLATLTLSSAIDLDSNGFSDVFELVYFDGPTDPNADADGDGLSNYEEMSWGSDPTNASSCGPDFNAALSGNDLVLTWQPVAHRHYELLVSENLEVWQVMVTNLVSPHVEHVMASTGPSWRFYQLHVSLDDTDSKGDGLADWERALYERKFGLLMTARDNDGDGLNDLQEFQQGRKPGEKDHPAVGLVVFTPLEK
jgi:hypothetical protein